jgi:Domain of unknown function (DUF4833)
MFFTQSEQYNRTIIGQYGRPNHYPRIAKEDGLLFYIQRNQNINTVTYSINTLSGDILNLENPISVQWIKYDSKGVTSYHKLNQIQNSLAYGYHSKVISNDLIEFKFVSYADMTFYLTKAKSGKYEVHTYVSGTLICLDCIYIYAEDLGIFPQVKFAEFFGIRLDLGQPFYHKLIIDKH